MMSQKTRPGRARSLYRVRNTRRARSAVIITTAIDDSTLMMRRTMMIHRPIPPEKTLVYPRLHLRIWTHLYANETGVRRQH